MIYAQSLTRSLVAFMEIFTFDGMATGQALWQRISFRHFTILSNNIKYHTIYTDSSKWFR
jgi:hypothetical protein